eukprot:Sspe_Gene.114978::Locus_101467_Transcript_1_1_Confidence_1.000_Length_523::g.114978::m.114978
MSTGGSWSPGPSSNPVVVTAVSSSSSVDSDPLDPRRHAHRPRRYRRMRSRKIPKSVKERLALDLKTGTVELQRARYWQVVTLEHDVVASGDIRAGKFMLRESAVELEVLVEHLQDLLTRDKVTLPVRLEL